MKRLLIILLPLFFMCPSSAQNHWQISGSAGFVSSEFLVKSPLGFEAEGRIAYILSDSVQLTITSGFSRWEKNLGTGGNRLKSIPVLAGIRYLFPLGAAAPYVNAEFGVRFITRHYIFENWGMSERYIGAFTLISSKPETESVTKFTFRLGIGIVLPIYKNIDMDISIRYSSFSYDFIYIYPTRMSTGSLFLYSFSAGFNYKF